MSFKRVVHQPAYASVVRQIQELIRNGEVAPGDQLLPERQLAEKLGVSRSSLREAFAMLAGMGILEVSPRDGAYIKRQSLEDAVQPLAMVIFQERENVRHLMEVRGIIETQAVRLAADRATMVDVERLKETMGKVEADVRSGRCADDSDVQFHLGLVESAKNPLLTQVMAALSHAMLEVYGPTRRRLLADEELAPLFIEDHYLIVEAIKRRDPDSAEVTMRKHIARTLDWELLESGEAGAHQG